jgi:hypothetical protein
VASFAQRQRLVRACPPAAALGGLPRPLQRLVGYGKPGPVLNKLYCGTGDSDVLVAFAAYRGRAIDWAGAA